MNKFLLSSLMAAAAAAPAVAGVDNINYQAVLKNNNTVLADQKVEMKFELVDSSNAVVYSEEQTPMTNGAGLVSVQLGGGDKLTDINWGDLKLRVSVNLNNGYEVISNEPVSSVPTALYALTTADNEEIKDAVNDLMQDMDVMKENFLGSNAELVRLDGAVEELSANFENLGENLTMSFEAVDAKIELVEAQLENLNNVSAVVRQNEEDIKALNDSMEQMASMVDAQIEKTNNNLGVVEKDVEELNTNVEAFADMVEARIDKIEKGAGDTDNDLENLKENLTNSFQAVDARFEEVDAQLENLNMVSAVVRQNEETLETLDQDVYDMQGSIQRNANNITELQSKVNENYAEYQEDFQKMADVTANITTTLDENYDELKGYNERNEQAISVLQGKVGDIEEEVGKLVQEQDNTAETILGINAELVKLNGVADDYTEFKEEYEENFQKMSEVTANLTTQADENYDELKGYIERNEQAISVLQGKQAEDIDSLTEQVDAFATMNEARLDKMQNQLDEADKTADENYDDLKGSIERNASAIQPLQGKVADLEDEVEKLVQEQDNTAETILGINAEIVKMNGVVDDLDSTFELLGQNNERIIESIDQLNTEVEGLVKDNENTQNDIKNMKADIAQIEGLGDEIEGIKESTENMASMIDAQIEKTNNNLSVVEAEVEKLVQANEDTQNDIKNMKADIAQIEGLGDKVTNLEDSMYELASPLNPDSMLSQIGSGMAELESKMDDNYDDLVGKFEKQTAENNDLWAKIKELENLVEMLQDKVNELSQAQGGEDQPVNPLP